MKRFSFRLEKILRYRAHREKTALRELFNARHELLRRKEAVKRLSARRMEITRQCSREGFRGMDVPRYQIYRSFLQRLDKDLEEADDGVKKGKEKVKAQELTLREESIRKKSLESLKDLKLKRYLEAFERETQKELDEIVLMRKGRIR